jgi:hypothetical protein
MASSLVADWFSEGFAQLHPQLQQLHQQGGQLDGVVDVQFGQGLAGFIGQRLAKKLGIPTTHTPHHLTVDISHSHQALHWHRSFDNNIVMPSVFYPTGHWPTGYWTEKTGHLQMDLAVDVIDGAWFWRCVSVRVGKLPVPLWLMPQMTAYKTIEQQQYRFYVGFSLPVLGLLLSYSGLLQLKHG